MDEKLRALERSARAEPTRENMDRFEEARRAAGYTGPRLDGRIDKHVAVWLGERGYGEFWHVQNATASDHEPWHTSCEHITTRTGRRRPWATPRNADGTAVRIRVNGKCKTWKRSPHRWQLPVKYGFRECFYVTPHNAACWTTNNPDRPQE